MAIYETCPQCYEQVKIKLVKHEKKDMKIILKYKGSCGTCGRPIEKEIIVGR